MLLAWLACQTRPVKHEKIRDICNSCVFSVTGEKETHSLYRYFYPLVRAGFVECGTEKRQAIWQLAKPMVFYKDLEQERRWIGINLTEPQKNLIPSHFDLIEDESSLEFEQHSNVIRWVTPREYDGTGLPIIHNPSIIALLKCCPACSMKLFSQKEHFDILKCRQIYSPQENIWKSIKPGPIISDGLYRVSEQIFSRRIYYHAGDTYSLGNEVNDSFWAKAQHCIDSNVPVARYDTKAQCVTFYIEPPFILSRILSINQMFEKFLVNSKKYYKITKPQIAELQRIFCTKINEGDNNYD